MRAVWPKSCRTVSGTTKAAALPRGGEGGGVVAAVVGSGLLGELDVDDELDLLGDQDAALFQAGVPGQAPVGAVELAGGLEGGLVVAPGVGGDAVELDVEGDRLGDALDGQVAGEGVAV